MIVVDASLGLEMFLRGPDAIMLTDRIAKAGREMAAPEVFDLEVLQTLRRLERNGQISKTRASASLDIFRSAPIERYAHGMLSPRIWALRYNLTAYDAAYFALAEALGVPLWTRDAKYLCVPGHEAVVALI